MGNLRRVRNRTSEGENAKIVRRLARLRAGRKKQRSHRKTEQ